MKIRMVISMGCFMIMASLQAQDFEGLTDKKDVNVFSNRRTNIFIRYTSLGGKYTKTYDGFTANFSYRNESTGKGELSYNLENPVIGDLLWAILNGTVNNSNEQALSSGLIGWHKFHWNIVATDRLLISPGFTFGDYIFASERLGVTPNVLEPNGYYLGAGPSLKTNYVITKHLWMDIVGGMDFSFAKLRNSSAGFQTVDGYPKPRFFQFGVTAYHTSRFSGGIRIVQAIDKGENKDKASRLDISVGYLFGSSN